MIFIRRELIRDINTIIDTVTERYEAEIARLSAASQIKGCICPPTSEKTCERWDCGRKTLKVKID